MTTRSRPLLVPLVLLSLAACAGGDEPPGTTQESGSASVTILEPAQGAEVGGARVLVRLDASGVDIVPAGDMTPGTGHHHLYLDDDVGPPGVPVQAIEGRVIHMGTGVSEYTFVNVPRGTHRLIAVVGDGVHVPLYPLVTDTVTFAVR